MTVKGEKSYEGISFQCKKARECETRIEHPGRRTRNTVQGLRFYGAAADKLRYPVGITYS